MNSNDSKSLGTPMNGRASPNRAQRPSGERQPSTQRLLFKGIVRPEDAAVALPTVDDLDPLDYGNADAPIEDRGAEVQRVVARLMAIVEQHRADAELAGLSLETAALQRLLRALQLSGTRPEELQQRQVEDLLWGSSPLQAHLLRALFDDLCDEPQSIVYLHEVEPGVVRCEKMDPEFWQQCLRSLSRRFAQSPTSSTSDDGSTF